MLGSLLGGKKQKIAATGYNALPQNIRLLDESIIGELISTNPFDIAGYYRNPLNANQRLAGQVTSYDKYLSPQALNQTAMQFQNPYQDQVIGGINRQAQGAASQQRSALARLGALGSNRDFLGASDVELNRQDMIGRLLSDAYENSMQRAYTTGAGRFETDEAARQEKIALGDTEADIAEYNKSAPLRRLQDMQGFLTSVAGFDRTGTPATTKRSGGLLGSIGKIATPFVSAVNPLAGAAFGAATGLASGGGFGGALLGGVSGYTGGGGSALSRGFGQGVLRRLSGGGSNFIGPVQPLFGR